jgi:homoserine kinase
VTSEKAVARIEPLTVYAPASIGNLSVGFDALGLALAPLDGALLGDLVRLGPPAKKGRDWSLEVQGAFAGYLPEDSEQNIVIRCARRFQEEASKRGMEIEPLSITLDKRLPIGSGLGSSASSVVAALEALNRWHGHLFEARVLFGLMAEMEGSISGEIHLDNIAPCLYGGLRLCPPGSEFEYSLPWPVNWLAVVCWPGTELMTREARGVVPAEVPRSTAVRHAAQFARFVHALHIADTRLAAASVVDLIAEPHRRRLLPGFDEAKASLPELGALTVGISGSGPTIFALVETKEAAAAVADWMDHHYRKNELGFVHVCRADMGGARTVE